MSWSPDQLNIVHYRPLGGKMRGKSVLKNRIGNFTAVPNAFINDASISHEAFRVFVVLMQFTNAQANDAVAFPSYDTLKERTGICSFSTIAKAIRQLEEKGWLQRRKRFGQSTVYTLTSPTPDVELDGSPVLHGVESSPTPDVGQSYTPSKTNKKYLTRLTNKTLGADAPRVHEPEQTALPVLRKPVDPVAHAFERQFHARTPESVIRAWNAAPHVADLCIAFAEIFGITVTKTDKGKWLGGAARLYELRPSRDVLMRVKRDARGLTLTHPGAAYEMVKAQMAASATNDYAPAHPAIIPGRRILDWKQTADGMIPVYEAEAVHA